MTTEPAAAPVPPTCQARAGKVLTPSVKAFASTTKVSVLRPAAVLAPLEAKRVTWNSELEAAAVSGLRV